MDAAVTVGWGDEAHNGATYDVALEGVTDPGVTLSLDFGITGILKVCPSLGYSRLLRDEIRATAGDPDNVLFGVMLIADL